MPETLDEIKKYVGPFSGPQMDQIFYEILNYTSERFAKGTAGGVPVAAGTPGYQDNSLFYKNQAAAQVSLAQAAAAAAANSAQRAESAVPAGTDAAVLWTRDQSTELTADDKAVARKNIMAGGTNPNLLDNPFFSVNQRGFTSGANYLQFIADRWQTGNTTAITATRLEKGIEFAYTGTTSTVQTSLRQILPNGKDYWGKTVTFSILTNKGLFFLTATPPDTIPSSNWTVSGSLFSGGLYLRVFLYQDGRMLVDVLVPANTIPDTIIIYAAKLEIGTASTLANDAPPAKTELWTCQNYYTNYKNETTGGLAIASSINSAATYADFILTLPAPLRANPSITIAGSATLFDPTQHYFTVSSITLLARSNNEIMIRANATGLTAGTSYRLALSAGAVLAFSADL